MFNTKQFKRSPPSLGKVLIRAPGEKSSLVMHGKVALCLGRASKALEMLDPYQECNTGKITLKMPVLLCFQMCVAWRSAAGLVSPGKSDLLQFG